jgi:hypothetical protein
LKSLVRDMDDKLAEARDGRVALVDVSGVPRMLKFSSCVFSMAANRFRGLCVRMIFCRE